MGMDYIALAPTTAEAEEGYHLNWSGHRYMAELLDGLGADLDEWAGSNDGDTISAETCAYWAGLLEGAIEANRIKERRVPDASYGGGYATWPEIVDAERTSVREMYDRLNVQLNAMRGKDTAVAVAEVVEISENTKAWILSFATFLRDCGGCAQW